MEDRHVGCAVLVANLVHAITLSISSRLTQRLIGNMDIVVGFLPVSCTQKQLKEE